MNYFFNKKTKVMVRVLSDYIHIDGYTCNSLAFPFSICKYFFILNDDGLCNKKSKEWNLINRFSGQIIPVRFETKKQAEYFFQIFSELYNINDIDFKDPNSEIDYLKISQEVITKIFQKNYRKNNFGN